MCYRVRDTSTVDSFRHVVVRWRCAAGLIIFATHLPLSKCCAAGIMYEAGFAADDVWVFRSRGQEGREPLCVWAKADIISKLLYCCATVTVFTVLILVQCQCLLIIGRVFPAVSVSEAVGAQWRIGHAGRSFDLSTQAAHSG